MEGLKKIESYWHQRIAEKGKYVPIWDKNVKESPNRYGFLFSQEDFVYVGESKDFRNRLLSAVESYCVSVFLPIGVLLKLVCSFS